MTAAKLIELEAKATPGPVDINPVSAHPSFHYAQHPEYQFQARKGDVALYAYLRNHAQDFIKLMEAAEYCQRQAESQRVWGGTEWKYPFPWKRVFDSTTEALAPFKEKS